jgi:Carboxypeptidase regulatory-like domain
MTKWLLLVFLFLPQRPLVGSGAIAGEIRLPDGTPAAGVRVSAMAVPAAGAAANGITVLDRITETDPSGRYRLESVPPGEYYILAGAIDAPTYYPGASDLSRARTITVTSGSNSEGMDFRIPRMPVQSPGPGTPIVRGYISGRVVTDNGRRFPLFLPSLYIFVENGPKTMVGADGVKIRGTGTFGATLVSKDGTFRLFLANGEYRISLITSLGEPLTSADGYYVKSITSDGTDLLKEKLKIKPSTVQTVTITLAAAP